MSPALRLVSMYPPQVRFTRATCGYWPQKSAPAGGGVVHVTLACAGALVPIVFVAVTEYEAWPSELADAWQVRPLPMQFVHVYEDGDCVQFAVSVTVPPRYGVVVLGESVQTGAAVTGCCHVIVTSLGTPMPFALMPCTR